MAGWLKANTAFAEDLGTNINIVATTCNSSSKGSLWPSCAHTLIQTHPPTHKYKEMLKEVFYFLGKQTLKSHH